LDFQGLQEALHSLASYGWSGMEDL
jgi:hypothetical protein